MVDDSGGALADLCSDGLLCNFFERRCARADSARARRAAERAEAYGHHLRNFAFFEMLRVVGRNEVVVAADDQAVLSEVEGHHWNFLLQDILPNIALGPVGEQAFRELLAGRHPAGNNHQSRKGCSGSIAAGKLFCPDFVFVTHVWMSVPGRCR